MKKILLLTWICCFSISLFGQIPLTQTRLKAMQKHRDGIYTNDKITLTQTKKKIAPNFKWTYQWYDANSELEETKTVEIPTTQQSALSDVNDKSYYSFHWYQKRDLAVRKGMGGNTNEFTLVTLDNENFELTKVDGEFPEGVRPMAIYGLGQNVIIPATIKTIPHLLSIDSKTGEQKLVKLEVDFPTDEILLRTCQISQDSKAIYLITEVDKKKGDGIYIFKFNPQLELQKSFELIALEPRVNLDNIIMREVNEENLFFTGTYYNSKILSKGFFSCSVKQEKIGPSQFIRLFDLDNFNFAEKEQKKVEKLKTQIGNINNEKNSKVSKIEYGNGLHIHDLLNIDDKYFLVGQTYEVLDNGTYVGPTGAIRTMPGTSIKNINIFVICFNNDGTLAWDNSFGFSENHQQNTPILPIIKINDANSNIEIIYAANRKPFKKIIDINGKVSDGKK